MLNEENKENNSVETPTEGSEPTWWIDENLPGVGDRPEWMPEKFKSVADMSKSYSELEKRFGSAPKEYDLSKAQDWLDLESESIKGITEMARQRGIPQDFMDNILDTFGEQFKAGTVDEAAERAKLGEKGDEILSGLNTFIKSNFGEDVLNSLAAHMNTAEAILALNKVKEKMLENMPKVPGDEGSGGSSETLAEIEKEMEQNLDKYKDDPKYRAELQKRMERVASQSSFKDI